MLWNTEDKILFWLLYISQLYWEKAVEKSSSRREAQIWTRTSYPTVPPARGTTTGKQNPLVFSIVSRYDFSNANLPHVSLVAWNPLIILGIITTVTVAFSWKLHPGPRCRQWRKATPTSPALHFMLLRKRWAKLHPKVTTLVQSIVDFRNIMPLPSRS